MERPQRLLDPKVRTLWWTVGLIVATLISVTVSLAASIIAVADPRIGRLWLLLAGFVWLGSFIPAAIVPPLMYRRWRYEIRERDVFISKGAIFVRLTLIPFDRIQYVESRQGPMDRLFGLAQVVVYTAAGKAGQIPGLAITEAESMREELSKVAGTISV